MCVACPCPLNESPDLQGKPKRAFVQTFFLAVQEKGYFVLNDLFRYLPEAPQSAPEPETHTAPPPFAPIENGYSQPAAPTHVPYPPQVRSTACLLIDVVGLGARTGLPCMHPLH